MSWQKYEMQQPQTLKIYKRTLKNPLALKSSKNMKEHNIFYQRREKL